MSETPARPALTPKTILLWALPVLAGILVLIIVVVVCVCFACKVCCKKAGGDQAAAAKVSPKKESPPPQKSAVVGDSPAPALALSKSAEFEMGPAELRGVRDGANRTPRGSCPSPTMPVC